MRVLFLSENGEGLGLATHLSSEGHAVNFIVPAGSHIGQGLVGHDAESAPDFVVYASANLGRDADEYRQSGKRTLGSSRWGELIESNPEYTDSLIKSIGWSTNSIDSGINLYITGWFNGRGFLSSYVSLVYRRFMSGGRGPDINFTGVVSNFWQPTERILESILKPVSHILKKVNHRGPIHIHTLIDGDRYCVKELSASLAHPLSTVLFENTKASVSDILLRLFNEDSKSIIPIAQWACGVMISIPPYPYQAQHNPISIKGIIPDNIKHMWLVDVKRDNEGYSTTGESGKIGYVTARGDSVHESVRRAYRTINNLSTPDLQYRDDVGRNITSLLERLREYQWIK